MSRTNKWQPEKEKPRKLKSEQKKRSSTKRKKYLDYTDDSDET
ncbi:hypothetical protein ES705_46209 [subsurface metagenome]